MLTLVAVAATFGMMLLTTADAGGRYLFNRPILAAYELTTNYLMIAAVFLALPYAYRQGANIRVTFLVDRLGRRARLVVDHLVQLVSIALLRGARLRHLPAGPPHAVHRDDVHHPRSSAVARAPARLHRAVPHHPDDAARPPPGAAGTLEPLHGRLAPWPILPFVVMMVALLLGLPIAFSLAVAGIVGIYLLTGDWNVVLRILGTTPFSTVADYVLTTIPMFILMAYFSASGGLARDLYTAGAHWLSRVKGGLAIATVFACGIFGAMSGASLAAAAVMSSIAMPEMRRHGYSDELAAGSIGIGATLDILIPPSVGMVIYGIMTQTSIGKLLIAGVVPGIIVGMFLILAILVWVRVSPSHAPETYVVSAGRALGEPPAHLVEPAADRPGRGAALRGGGHADRGRRPRRLPGGGDRRRAAASHLGRRPRRRSGRPSRPRP